MTPIQFPNERLTQSITANPLFITDIESLTKNLIIALKSALGLEDFTFSSTFWIVSGFEYAAGEYGPGLIYFDGNLYYFSGTLTEGQSLQLTTTDILSKLHEDNNSYYTYKTYVASAGTTVGIPNFTGDMNEYRLGNQILKAEIAAVVSDLSELSTKVSDYMAGNVLKRFYYSTYWNMDIIDVVDFISTIPNAAEIIEIHCTITDNTGTLNHLLTFAGNIYLQNDTTYKKIYIGRTTSGFFDSSSYNTAQAKISIIYK